MNVESISAVTLKVRNMKASVDFYRDVLGMEVLYGSEGSGFSSLRPGIRIPSFLTWNTVRPRHGGAGSSFTLQTLMRYGRI